jgi:hypothetical protein
MIIYVLLDPSGVFSQSLSVPTRVGPIGWSRHIGAESQLGHEEYHTSCTPDVVLGADHVFGWVADDVIEIRLTLSPDRKVDAGAEISKLEIGIVVFGPFLWPFEKYVVFLDVEHCSAS